MDACVSGDTVVGIYQFANGTNKNDTTFEEIKHDLLLIGAPFNNNQLFREHTYARQLLPNAQFAKNEIESFIYDREITVSGTDHTQLRRLLDVPDGYWAAVIVKSIVAAGVGGVSFAIGKSSSEPVGTRAAEISIIASLGAILVGIIELAQRTGRLSYVGALLGITLSALLRQEVGRVNPPNPDIENGLRSTTSYLTTTSSLTRSLITTSSLTRSLITTSSLTSSESAMPSPSSESAMPSPSYGSAMSSLNYESSMSSITSYESAMSSFNLEHPAEGLQCQF